MSLQKRQKWFEPQRNFKVGDLVLIAEESHRGNWPMGRVIAVHPGPDGLVRHVSVKVRDGIVSRPVVKLCFLESF